MKKSTKACEFSKATRERIYERDKQCVFCKYGYRMGEIKRKGQGGFDFAHIIPRSQLGLGVEQNGFLCCRTHHHMFDNSEHRNEMKPIIKGYMAKHYKNYDEREYVYSKWKNS